MIWSYFQHSTFSHLGKEGYVCITPVMISPRRRFNDEAHHRSHQITKGADIVVKSCSRQLSGTHHLTLPQKPSGRQGQLLTHVVPRMFQTRTRLRKHAQFVPKTYPRFVHLPNSIWDVSQPNDLDRIRIDPNDGTGTCSAVDSFHAVHPQTVATKN